MPFKHNASRRHRIGKMKFKVTNWPEYEAGLRTPEIRQVQKSYRIAAPSKTEIRPFNDPCTSAT
jgi:hypothetical protein